MNTIVKIELSDIVTKTIGENIALVLPGRDYTIIFDREAAIYLSRDIESLTGDIKKGLLACTVCFKILPVSDMYTVDACSPECQAVINGNSITVDGAQRKHSASEKTEEDFRHFLAYTGYSSKQENIISWMREAYYAATPRVDTCKEEI